MKGVILAGGRGTRLAPFTRLIKKELLPVYDKPLIYYPLETLKQSGITDIILVSDPRNIQSFLDVLGEGEDMGIKIQYTIQNKQLGIANALYQARPFIDKEENTAVMLGDNIFTENFETAVRDFTDGGATIAVTQVKDPERFGVVSFEGDKVTKIVEKPKEPESDWVSVGFYLYDNTLFDKIEKLNPSARGEYEITDVNNQYLDEGKMRCVKMDGKWFDAGTFDSL
ncbi:MAG: sugar nucleotidyltransferase, partial [Candidatus Colwellbacteria bacterium]|nr:sugar nucleotidyltransferase [Candidatus Colwellbacteria bacterium]